MGENSGSRPARARRATTSSALGRLWYESVRLATLATLCLRGGVRVSGREHLPKRGGALIVSNHLSFLDVFVLGLGVPRRVSYVARSTLFKPLIGPFIRSIGAFPIEREGGGVSGLKETLKRLKASELVLIFPEGTRSPDGEIQPLKPGISALVRAGVPFIPAAVAGTFEAFPRGAFWPRAYPLWIHFGPPIPAGSLAGLGPEAITDRILAGMLAAQREARSRLIRLQGIESEERNTTDTEPVMEAVGGGRS
jgi:1-acyl-sn-glycerol-3-phosphate acyltransferase